MRKKITSLALTGLLAALVGCSDRSPVGSASTADQPFALAAGVIVPDSVKTAALSVYCSGPSLQTVNVYRVTAPWAESTVTWNSFAGAYDTAAVHGSFAAAAPGWKTAEVTALVRQWVGGAAPNCGLLLGQTTNLFPRGMFFSRENAFMQPYLTVTYGGPTGDTSVQFPVLRDAAIDESVPNNPLGLAQLLFTGWAADGGLKNQSLLLFDLPVYNPPPPDGDSTGIDEPNDTTITDPPDTTIIEPGDPDDQGCTRPWPWWLRHSGCAKGSESDEISALLPLWVGTPGGAHSVEIDSNCKAAQSLQRRNHDRTFPPVKPLLTELLAAKLNIAAGADDSAVAGVIAAADAYLATHPVDSRRSVDRRAFKQIHEWYRALHAFNVGDIGPGACAPDADTSVNPRR